MENLIVKDKLEEIINSSFSIAEVLRKLGLKINGNNYGIISKKIKEFNFSINHFSGKSWSKGKILLHGKEIDDYLNNKVKIKPNILKKYLFELEIKDKSCESCNLNTWLNNNIPLELHHIDGNNLNNNLENLQVLCPNCHALTDNYKRKK